MLYSIEGENTAVSTSVTPSHDGEPLMKWLKSQQTTRAGEPLSPDVADLSDERR